MTKTARPASRDKLAGKKIAIIGGTSGIGFGCARVFLDHGAHVTLISSQASQVSAAVARLNAAAPQQPSSSSPPPTVTGHVGDVCNETAFTALLQSLAPLDHIVFTSVDLAIRGPLATADLADARALFGVKFWGSVGVAKALAAHAIVAPGGSLTLTSGLAGLRPGPGAAIGAALNGGVEALTRGLALELAGRRVRVNAVVPGLCRTELWERMGHSSEARAALLERGERELSVGFVGCPEDVAEAYLFFVRADYVNGTTVIIGAPVDGGAHI